MRQWFVESHIKIFKKLACEYGMVDTMNGNSVSVFSELSKCNVDPPAD